MPISNYLAPSAIAKPGVCTSSTRPASPYEGQVIYETDTDRVLVWNANAWVMPSAFPANVVYDTTNRTITGTSAWYTTSNTLSVTLGTGSTAMVIIGALSKQDNDTAGVGATFAVSGATTVSAATIGNSWQTYATVSGANGWANNNGTYIYNGLTAGSNTFTLNHYHYGTGTTTVGYRMLAVVPL